MKFCKILFLLLLQAFSFSLVVVNSQDATDVSSAVSYANLKGEEIYIIYPGDDLFYTAPRLAGRGNILLVESSTNPMFSGLRGSLESSGNTVELVSSTGTDLNLQLARRSGARKFIVTDPVYGYNVVSLIPYARSTGAYIIFANKSNAVEVSSFLSQNPPDSVLFYGNLDEEFVQSAGNLRNPETISNGDKYYDNIELLEKYYSIHPENKDVIFADGTFLEVSLVTGDFPVILVSQLIPERTFNFVLQKVTERRIVAGTLVGIENVDPVYDMMKRINSQAGEKMLRVFVKFGQAAAGTSEPAPLRTYLLPVPFAEVSLDSASYNPATGSFEFVYSNKGNADAYVRSNIVVLLDGREMRTLVDDDAYLIRRGETKGVRYPFENPGEGQLSINDTTYYGTSKYSFDKGFIKYMDVGRISFVDQSSLALSDAAYSPLGDKLTVKVRNNGSTGSFYRLTISYVNDEGLTVYETEQVRNLSAGRNEIITLEGVIQLPAEKAGNTMMNVTALYGAREAFLEKNATAEAKIESFPWWILLILLLVILAIAYWYFSRKKKGEKKEEPKEEQKEVAKKKKKAK